jgi:hypothetical protein
VALGSFTVYLNGHVLALPRPCLASAGDAGVDSSPLYLTYCSCWVCWIDGERIAELMLWLIVPVLVIWFLFSRFGWQPGYGSDETASI